MNVIQWSTYILNELTFLPFSNSNNLFKVSEWFLEFQSCNSSAEFCKNEIKYGQCWVYKCALTGILDKLDCNPDML